MPNNIPPGSDFSLHNLPFGIFSTSGTSPRVGIAVGDRILDLSAVGRLGWFDFDPSVLSRSFLNDFIRLGQPVTEGAGSRVKEWLRAESAPLDKPSVWVDRATATMHLPVQVGDYTDFYSSIEHAANVGKLFRDPENALLPNWRHLPIGYHGRASSIVVSGTPVRRPKGQYLAEGERPVFGPSQQLDFELELAFIIGKDSVLGQPIPIEEAEDYIFGFVLFNDWSARDLQRWEYRPLGPFLGKSFASSVSPWVVPLASLRAFRTRGPAQKPEVLDYLKHDGAGNFDLQLEAHRNGQLITRTNAKNLYWNAAQQLAHHTSNGCNVRVGDIMASGTISGSEPGSYGSLLEMQTGFLEDGDVITLTGWGERDGLRVGFGEVSGKILPTLRQPKIVNPNK